MSATRMKAYRARCNQAKLVRMSGKMHTVLLVVQSRKGGDNTVTKRGAFGYFTALGVLTLFAAWVWAPAPAAAGTTITVNTTNDELAVDGNCSLREAITAANSDAAVDACSAGNGADTVVVPGGTYNLTIPGGDEYGNATGDLDIRGDVTVQGAGAGTTV